MLYTLKKGQLLRDYCMFCYKTTIKLDIICIFRNLGNKEIILQHARVKKCIKKCTTTYRC